MASTIARHIRLSLASALTMLLLAACMQQGADPHAVNTPPPHTPQRAGQPLDPTTTAAHIIDARLSAIAGDQQGVQRNVNAMSEDMRRAMKVPDPGRPIDHEAARAIARSLPGVRSANWVDRGNLLVRVDGAQWRSQRTIDELCYQLEALGDTLAVVVHLQNAAPATRDEMDTLSRNCQLAPGDRSAFVQGRTIDALDPEERARQRAFAEQVRARPRLEMTKGDEAAVEAMREM